MFLGRLFHTFDALLLRRRPPMGWRGMKNNMLTESKNQSLIKKDLSLTGVIGDVSPLFDMFKIHISTYHVQFKLCSKISTKILI